MAPRKDKKKQQDCCELLKPCEYDIVVASNVYMFVLCVNNAIKMVILKSKGPLICMSNRDFMLHNISANSLIQC